MLAALLLAGRGGTGATPVPLQEADVNALPSLFVTSVVAAERIPLPRLRGPAQVRVDALRSTVEITAPRDLGAVAAKISSGLGHICPRWEVDGGRILLRCRTRQLAAQIRDQGGKKYLDLQELRGLPREEQDDRLQVFYDPGKLGGGACPGMTPIARGECALHEGDRAGARESFKEAWEGANRTVAALRLGDLAADEDNMADAALWWSRAGSTGPFGRLARGRLCEARGDCLAGPTSHIFDGGEIPEPMRTELALRAARIDLFGGRTGLALRWIGGVLRRQSGGCVGYGRAYCRRMILAALEEDRADGGKEALDIYLLLPDRSNGPYALELAAAAAERAAPLGAPVFAANLYASVAGLVPAAATASHLARIVELFLDGEDRARAQLVVDYAETRLEARELSGSRWATVRKRLLAPTAAELERQRREKIEREIVGAEAARDLANAVRVLARSKSELP